jgi:hypothetical protein
MKKEFKPIAMRFTKEQFEPIRKILLDNEFKIGFLFYSDMNIYLVNNFGGIKKFIDNITPSYSEYLSSEFVRPIFNEWNEEIFLEYCGIDVKKK